MDVPVSATQAPGGERWKTRLGVILAVAGSAVGLGNFLRFPGQAVEHGGGAFMIPYFFALVFLGIPMGWAEWTMGRYGGSRGLHSAPGILGLVGRRPAFRYWGVLGLLVPLVVYMYYVVIESWCLRYAWGYLSGSIDLRGSPSEQTAGASALFESAAGSSGHGALFSGGLGGAIVFWGLVFVVNVWLVRRGLSRGIELFCRWAMPAMAVCAVIVLVRVLTLGTPDPAMPDRNVEAGLGFMWNPDFSRLTDFTTWLAAAGQVFFSLSIGFGVIINYASYLTRKDDVVLSGLTASATNELFEVGFGGMITVTATFVFLGASATAGGTFGLGFHALPVVFAQMGEWGRPIGALWFSMLFLAAITSSLSMLQPVKAFLQEALGISATRAVAFLTLLAATGSLWVLYFSGDLVALETLDFWVGTFAIMVLATVEAVCFAWVLGVDRGFTLAHMGARMRIPPVFRSILTFVTPTYLLVVLAGFCIQKLPGHARELASETHDVQRATLWGVAAVVALLLFLIRLGAQRWKQAEAIPETGEDR